MGEACRGAAPLSLPDELWARVLASCDYVEAATLARCSRQLRRLSDAPELWRRLCAAHGFGPPRAGVQSWKALFETRCAAAHCTAPRATSALAR